MTKENIISIYNNIKEEMRETPVKFDRFRSCNTYIASDYLTVKDDTDNTYHSVRVIKSYETIVAFYDCTEHCFCEIGKFSPTTSKQLTQIYREYYSSTQRVNAMYIIW